jgi:hypothetical protein
VGVQTKEFPASIGFLLEPQVAYLTNVGRRLGTTGYASAQVWYLVEFEGIPAGHLADMERMLLQSTVNGQPPRHDGAKAGWVQGISYRLLAGRPTEGSFGLLAPQEHLVARGAKWATKLVEGLCPPALHKPGYPPPPPPPIRLPEPEELPGGVRPMADQPVRSYFSSSRPCIPSPGWVELARAVLLCV